MSTMEMGYSENHSKSKEMGSQKGKRKEIANMDYDDTRFTVKIEEKLYSRVWVKNGPVIEREFNVNSFENMGFGYLEDLMN